MTEGAVRPHLDILFGLGGNDAPYLGEGWAEAEPGQRWTLGGACDIRMRHPGSGDLLLEIDAFPLIVTPAVALQRIEVVANGVPAGTLTLHDHHRRALHIPSGLVPAGETLTLQLVLPDAAQPKSFGPSGDTRILAACFSRLSLFTVQPAQPKRLEGTGGISLAAFAARAGVPPGQALARFEGLGACFPLAAARSLAGVKAPGLLENATIRLQHVLQGIESGFEGLGEPGSFDVSLPEPGDTQFAILDRAYAATFRSNRLAGNAERQGAWLRDLRRALAQLLGSGERIFVLPATTFAEQEVLPLLIALARQGPARLVWVTYADDGHPPGTVEQTAANLLRGWVGQADGNAGTEEAALASWLELCAHVLAIVPFNGAEPAFDAASSHTIGSTDTLPQSGDVDTLPEPAAPAPARRLVRFMDGEYGKLQELVFGAGGNEEASLGFGWSGPEDGFRWTDGSASELWLEHPGERRVVVSIEAWPFVNHPLLSQQVAEFSAQDVPLGTLTFRDPSRLALHIAPGTLRPGRILRLRCGLPSAARPVDVGAGGDDRQLGLGFINVRLYSVSGVAEGRRDGVGGIDPEEAEGRTGLLPEDLLLQFEPLGETRALANLQAAFGVARHGLLRTSSLRLIDLVRGLDARFAGLGDPARLRQRPFGDDGDVVEITDAQTNLSFLAERTLGDSTPDLLLARQSRRLKFLREQLMYDVSVADKIFVYHRAPRQEALSEASMLPLLIALRQHGPCTLLFVTPEDQAHPSGTVEWIFPGLLHGYINASEETHEDITRAVWLEICANAIAMVS